MSDEPLRDNEAVYDNEIAPLMAQIIDICERHNLPMFATFVYGEGDGLLFCTTKLPVAPEGHEANAIVDGLFRVVRPPAMDLTTYDADGKLIAWERILP